MVDRRLFLQKAMRRLLLLSGVAFLIYPVASFMTFRKSKSRVIVFRAEEMALSVNYKEGVFLVINGKERYALSARCTHLGCTVSYDAFSKKFRCPCHGSVFAVSGERLEGPARRGLERVPWKRKESGEIVATLTL